MVGNVKWIYAYNESNWSIHEQAREVQPGDVVLIEAFNCKNQATIGELVSKFMLLYKEAVAVISNAPLRDANDLIKQNFLYGVTGFTPVGCSNKKIEKPLDEEIYKQHKEKI